MVFAGVVALLFATLPDPDRRGWAYLWGVVLGQGLGLFVKYALLAAPSSYGLLAAILRPFIFIGAIGMTDLRNGRSGRRLQPVLHAPVQPANPMQYDLAATLNESIAIFSGIAFGVTSFRIVLPERVWRTAQ